MRDRLLRLDTNLLVLLIAGLVDIGIIAENKHKRLRKYYPADFALLVETIAQRRLCLVPNVATETHNLLGQHGEPERTGLLRKLSMVLQDSVEDYVPSKIAATHAMYARIGLTDAAIFVTRAPTLLTDDFGLYIAASRDGQHAIMFTHLRVDAGIIKPP